MLWTDCPDDETCDKCLDVAFESGNDIACLNEKFPDTECILEGNFINGGAIVFVSSEQCINGGDMDHIQVHPFHKGLLVGSDSRKNLTRVLLVSRDMCQIFFWTLYGFSWSSGVT